MAASLISAQGLYYIADLVEEHGSIAKRVVRYTVFIVLGTHVVLFLLERTKVVVEGAGAVTLAAMWVFRRAGEKVRALSYSNNEALLTTTSTCPSSLTP